MSSNNNHSKDSCKHPLAEDFVRHSERKTRLLFNLDFVCTCNSMSEGHDFVEAVYLRRRMGRDEIWTAWSIDFRNMDSFVESGHPRLISAISNECCLEFSVITEGDKPAAALRLLEILTRGNHSKWPTSFVRPGLVDETSFKGLLADLEPELKANAKQAMSYKNAPIVVAARELGLNPCPTGGGSIHWEATCPGTNHTIMIGGSSNEFGCGWCRKRGGPDELRAFVQERKELKASLNAKYGEVHNG